VPRRLNVLAGRVLLQAAIEGVELIGHETVERRCAIYSGTSSGSIGSRWWMAITRWRSCSTAAEPHRLAVAGWTGRPDFAADAFDALYAASGGVPRRLNALAQLLDGGRAQQALAEFGLSDQQDLEQRMPPRLEVGPR
jgi:hypothetical protein